MNQSKFSLADVLTVLAVLAFGFVSFLGANFMNISNDKVWGFSHTTGCVVMAVVITVLLFVTAFGAKLLKRTNCNFKTSFILEVVLLLLFVLFAVFFATKTSPFPHYFTVTAQKSEIKSKLQKSITQAENMFAEYEKYADNRLNQYRHNLISVANAKNINPNEYAEYGFNRTSGVSDASQIDTKMFALDSDLFPSNYSDTTTNNGIKEVATEWLQNARNITSGWKPIGIVGVVNEIEKKSKEWYNTLIRLSQVHERGESEGVEDFELKPPLSFDDVKTHFTKVDSPSLLSIGLAVLAYLLMLLSWFVTRRSTRFPGLKLLFGLGQSREHVW